MSNDDFPSRFRRRRFPFFRDWFFEDTDEVMKDMDKMMEEVFRRFTSQAPRNLIREKVGPEGRKIKEIGPLIYGYSMTIGPDGKPEIREFGNIKPSLKPSGFSFEPRSNIDVKGEREPLVDVTIGDDGVKVIAELPGVEKKDITLGATSNSLTIDVDTESRKYYKEFDLPVEVDPTSAKSSYKNGVLEVSLKKIKEKRTKGVSIKIE
jgi:HSP20 family protein